MTYYTPRGTEFEFENDFPELRFGICAKVCNDEYDTAGFGGETYAPDIQVYGFWSEKELRAWLDDTDTPCDPGYMVYAAAHTDTYDEGIDIMLHDVICEYDKANGHEYIPSDMQSLITLYENLCDSIRRGTYYEDYVDEESAY